METSLIFSETIFYLTVSAATISIGVLSAIMAYHLIQIAKELEGLSRNLNNASSESGERINDIINRLSGMPILSFFLKEHPAEHGKKVTKNHQAKK